MANARGETHLLSALDEHPGGWLLFSSAPVFLPFQVPGSFPQALSQLGAQLGNSAGDSDNGDMACSLAK